MKGLRVLLVLSFLGSSYFSCTKKEILPAGPAEDPFITEAITYLREHASQEVFESLDLSNGALIRVSAGHSLIARFTLRTDPAHSVTVVRNDEGITGSWMKISPGPVQSEMRLKSGSLDGRRENEVQVINNAVVRIDSKADGVQRRLSLKTGSRTLFVDENAITQKRNPDDEEEDETSGFLLPEYVVFGYSTRDPTPYLSLFWMMDMNQLYMRSYVPGIVIPEPGGISVRPREDLAAVEIEEFHFEHLGDIVKVKELMKCFESISDNGAKYGITLHTDLPVDDDQSQLLNGLTPGHTFISFTKSNGTSSITQNFGFYPKPVSLTIFNVGVPSWILDDEKHDFNSSISMLEITKAQFEFAGKAAEGLSENNYDLNDYNCTNYALDVFNSIRSTNNKIEVPDWYTSFAHINYGQTPNGLDKVLKKMKDSKGIESENIHVGHLVSGSSKGPCK